MIEIYHAVITGAAFTGKELVMQTRMKTLLIGAVGAAGLSAAALAFAGAPAQVVEDDKAEIAAFMASPITLKDAIARAETETGMRAIAAEFEGEDGAFVYAVELVSAEGREVEYNVDSKSGAVTIDPEDDEDDEDDDDDDNRKD